MRCGLHLGVVERRDDDLFGSPVNRAARIMSAAHGGQVLLSQAVVDQVGERLPPLVSLRDLGGVRLRDLAKSEHVYQLVYPGLREDFPALRSLEATPNNLPLQVTSFIGRERELAEIKRLLEDTRLLTLLGMGGLGKTRLSLQIAADVLENYPDGVWFVDLAPIKDPSLVPNAAAQVLGVREEPGKTLTQTLCEHVKDHKLLLVIDNCEHLVSACASLADALLLGAPGVRILATSREALHIRGEQTYPVLPLAAPDRKAGVEVLLRSEAVQLFVERAQLQRPNFTLTERDAPAVAEICARLDGIPLALELAAARMRSLSIGEINTRLHDRFKLLTGGSRVALERQQTLRALVSWSYDLLQEQEQMLLDRLSVFAGGFDLQAAEAVCSAEPLVAGRRDRSAALAGREIAGHGRPGRWRVALRTAGDDPRIRPRAPDQALRHAGDDPRIRAGAPGRPRRRRRDGARGTATTTLALAKTARAKLARAGTGGMDAAPGDRTRQPACRDCAGAWRVESIR